MGDLSLQELVDSYCQEPAEGLRNAIISKSMPLLRSIIGKIRKPDHPLTQDEDLESAAITGLIQALDSYDCSKKIQFNTYAYYRIRGNVIDYLRKVDQLPRIQRTNYGRAQDIIDQMSQKLGRVPEDEEVAAELDISLEDYRMMLSSVQQRNALSLDSRFDSEDGSMYDTMPDPDSEQPDSGMLQDAMIIKLRDKIGKLPERERLILTLYYFEDMTLSEIAVLLGLSEARISQIVGKLLIELKSDLKPELTR
ncbi:sigma-70 family RNA polymerase sigma factor [Natronogracilivirga saccharolytica]|uniref:FliA/WhiG family RNA polymerase sigma factor n=1 Tax=Natronogracilivirga saccharolytica TaxID=2812953 RepID=A0A8J7S4R0_9BACT|nr:FliA/WhiG family RNA polymerase sigma factor [Natronogracilivirga saccharolytica]MBP3191953.1 FliA/WhiG family RNA polymerase sigma factor [Natronogracilivirga saccharolytica]